MRCAGLRASSGSTITRRSSASPRTEYMLRQRYDPEVIRSELARGTIWWDVLREDGVMQAFASFFRVRSRHRQDR